MTSTKPGHVNLKFQLPIELRDRFRNFCNKDCKHGRARDGKMTKVLNAMIEAVLEEIEQEKLNGLRANYSVSDRT